MSTPLGVDVVGEGPPLVAVHGGLVGGRLTFGGVAPRWGRTHRVIVVDRPGFERTGGEGGIDVVDQAARLLSTIDQVADGGPVHAIGFSFGGLVVLRAVQDRPAAFASLVLVEVPAEDLCPPDMVHPVRFGAQVRRAHRDMAADPEAMGRFFSEVDPALWTVIRPRLDQGDDGITALPSDFEIWTARLDRARLAEVVGGVPPIPVLTVSGTQSDPVYRTFGACTAAALAGRHVVIDGAGHAAHLHPSFADLLEQHTGAAA